MSTYLLDVNVLIALIDPMHVHHNRAHSWFSQSRNAGWRSCPTTQNGVLRIVSNPQYPNHQPLPTVLGSLRSLLTDAHHAFTPDSLSLVQESVSGTVTASLLTSRRVTDAYLLALAAANGCKLATFDRRLDTSPVHNGQAFILHVP